MNDGHGTRFRMPAWAILGIGIVGTGAAIVWASNLTDDQGNALLDDGVIKIILALIGAAVTLMSFLLQRQNDVRHQVQNSHKTILRDDIDVVKDSSASAASDAADLKGEVAEVKSDVADVKGEVRQIRGELQDSRRETHERLHTQAINLVDMRKSVGAEIGGLRKSVGEDMNALRGDFGRLTDAVMKFMEGQQQ